MMATILLVDDEREIAEAIRSILEDEGYAVRSCSDGTQALEQLRRDLPNLVLSDVMMPRMSGLELLAAIRKEPRTRKVPVILMSAVSPGKNRSEAKWNDFLKKPFNLDALLDAVEKQLAK